jgi:hypothetical protein
MAVLFSIGCGSAPPVAAPAGPPISPAPPPTARAAPNTAFPDPAQRVALFHGIVGDVHKYHVFAEATTRLLGFTFDNELPALEKEFASASDEAHLDVAIDHLVNDLHNPHCIHESAFPQDYFATGITFSAEWRAGAVHFYVSKVPPALADRMSLGDELKSVEGIASADVLRRYANRSRQNNWHGIAREVAASIGGPYPLPLNAGTRTTFVVTKRGTQQEKTFDLAWTKYDWGPSGFDEYAVDYSKSSCSVLGDLDYGGYELVARGHNLCIYASRSPERRAYPIVRHFSFSYIGSGYQRQYAHHQVRADREVLVRELDRLKPKGVLLDVRDNAGGNNTNWFLDWYARGPYTDSRYRVRLHEDFDTEEKAEAAGIDNPQEYVKELRARAPGQTLGPARAGICKDGDCRWDGRYTPSHQVTTAPIALLVGPGCVSSCDQLARLFAKHHFGPVLGQPTATGFTPWRLRREITLPSGKKFGAYRLAFTEDFDGDDQQPTEGVPIALDVPLEPTFENKGKYDKLLVEAAIKALGNFPRR